MEQNIYSVLVCEDTENPSPNGVYQINLTEESRDTNIKIQSPKVPRVSIGKFFEAIKSGHLDEVYKAISYFSPNVTFKGNPVLNHAIYYNQSKIVEMLLEKGADPRLKSKRYNMTAYDEAHSKPEIIEILDKFE